MPAVSDSLLQLLPATPLLRKTHCRLNWSFTSFVFYSFYFSWWEWMKVFSRFLHLGRDLGLGHVGQDPTCLGPSGFVSWKLWKWSAKAEELPLLSVSISEFLQRACWSFSRTFWNCYWTWCSILFQNIATGTHKIVLLFTATCISFCGVLAHDGVSLLSQEAPVITISAPSSLAVEREPQD